MTMQTWARWPADAATKDARARELAEWIAAEQVRSGRAPSIREMCDRYDRCSSVMVVVYLRRAEELGLVEHGPKGTARCYHATRGMLEQAWRAEVAS